MSRPRPDIAGIISGTVFAGTAVIWLLYEHDVLRVVDLGVAVALLLVAAGVVGLIASRRA